MIDGDRSLSGSATGSQRVRLREKNPWDKGKERSVIVEPPPSRRAFDAPMQIGA
jgi:hypothetical protein